MTKYEWRNASLLATALWAVVVLGSVVAAIQVMRAAPHLKYVVLAAVLAVFASVLLFGGRHWAQVNADGVSLRTRATWRRVLGQPDTQAQWPWSAVTSFRIDRPPVFDELLVITLATGRSVRIPDQAVRPKDTRFAELIYALRLYVPAAERPDRWLRPGRRAVSILIAVTAAAVAVGIWFLNLEAKEQFVFTVAAGYVIYRALFRKPKNV